jgi:hypothetical protein
MNQAELARHPTLCPRHDFLYFFLIFQKNIEFTIFKSIPQPSLCTFGVFQFIRIYIGRIREPNINIDRIKVVYTLIIIFYTNIAKYILYLNTVALRWLRRPLSHLRDCILRYSRLEGKVREGIWWWLVASCNIQIGDVVSLSLLLI